VEQERTRCLCMPGSSSSGCASAELLPAHELLFPGHPPPQTACWLFLRYLLRDQGRPGTDTSACIKQGKQSDSHVPKRILAIKISFSR
jgi:hypothetical protein